MGHDDRWPPDDHGGWTTQELAVNESSTGSTGGYSVHWGPRSRRRTRPADRGGPTDIIRPVRCVQVDLPSQLYLAGEGLVHTHNSCLFSGLRLYLLFADREPGAEIYSAVVHRDRGRSCSTRQRTWPTPRRTSCTVCRQSQAQWYSFRRCLMDDSGLEGVGISLFEVGGF